MIFGSKPIYFVCVFLFLQFRSKRKKNPTNTTTQRNLQRIGVSCAQQKQALEEGRMGCGPGPGACRGRSTGLPTPSSGYSKK